MHRLVQQRRFLATTAIITAISIGAATPVIEKAVRPAAPEPYPVGVISYGDTIDPKVSGTCESQRFLCVRAPDGTMQPIGANTSPVLTSEVLGAASISKISVKYSYLGQNLRKEEPIHVASLQLNSEFFLRNRSNTYFYWIQNLLEIDTSEKTLYFMSNAWPNGSTKGFGADLGYEYNSMSGGRGGKVEGPPGSKIYYYIYAYRDIDPIPYSLPLNITLMNDVAAGSIYFQYSLNGGAPVTYDKLSITIPRNGEGFFTTGNRHSIRFYAAGVSEGLVFGGEGNHYAAYFSSMSADLSLYHETPKGLEQYTELQSASVEAYTPAYTTGETAANLQSAPSSGRIAVRIGDPQDSWSSYDFKEKPLSAVHRS